MAKSKTLATLGQGNVTVGGDALGEGETADININRDTDAIDKELYSIDRQEGNVDLTVDHEQVAAVAEKVAEVTVAVKREIQTWGDQAPVAVQAVLPEIEAFIDQAILDGKDVDNLLQEMNTDRAKESIAAFAPLAELAKTDPQVLKAQLAAGLEVKFITDEQGEDRITITGTGDVAAVTQVVDGVNSLMKVIDSAPDEIATVTNMVLTAAGGAAAIVTEVVMGILAQTEAGQAVLAKLGDGMKTLSSHVGTIAAGSDNIDEFTDDLTAEKRYGGSDFFDSMQGGGEGVVTLAAMLIGLKGLKGKGKGGE